MPLYEYECEQCGRFSDTRSMSACSLPAPCPRCGAGSPRVLSATAAGHGPRARKRGYRDPVLRKNDRDPPKEVEMKAPHPGGRPWMLGH